MKTNITTVAVMAALAVSVTSVNAIILDFDALANTAISFSGANSFDFTSNSSGNQFQITTVGQGTGAAVGLEGYITEANPFEIGQITASGPVETAPVTGTATLHIVDQNGIDLTGTLQLTDISTLYGTIGGVNFAGSVNLSDIQYSGTNPDLLALASSGSASDVLSFQFDSSMLLSELADTPTTTSYSGSFSAAGMTTVPEPAPSAILLTGICFCSMLARWRMERRS